MHGRSKKWEGIVAIVDAAGPAQPPFILGDDLAERYRQYANAIRGAGASEKLDAFTTCARLVAGMVDSEKFPLREAADRLLATAEAYGLVGEHGDDAIQARIAAAFDNPDVVDADSPNLSSSEPANTTSKARKRGRKPAAAEGGNGGGNDLPPSAPASDDGDAIPRTHGFSVDGINKEYAVVMVGSQAVVFHEQPHARLIEHQVRMLGIDGFKTWFRNRFTEFRGRGGKIKRTTWANAWLDARDRRQYQGIEFFPDPANAPGTPGYLNLWSGFAVKPAPVPDPKKYKTFRDHLLVNVCAGDEKLFRWVFGFFAQMVQRPRERLGVALVMRGKMGTGKTKVGEVIGALFPRHYFLVDDPRYVTGQFNAHMATCLLLQADEAVWAGDKAAEGRLKGLITSPMQQIEAKGIDPIRLNNYVRLIMTSNEDWVVPAGKDERRFCVVDVDPRCAQNHAYFHEMDEELAAGGLSHLLADLLAFDLDRIDLRNAPRTDALLEQKIRSLNSVESWWFGRLSAGTTTRHETGWQEQVPIAALFDDYIATAEKIGVKRKQEETVFGMTLAKLMPGLPRAKRRAEVNDAHGKRVWCYLLPPLNEARENFANAVGQNVVWSIDDEPIGGDSAGGEYDEFH
ncbi:MAG: primase-helicase family protein [Xanthobacteraceae bacterium]